MSDPSKLMVHLNENGSVDIMAHPSRSHDGAVVSCRFFSAAIEIHDWRYEGGDADRARWTVVELEEHG